MKKLFITLFLLIFCTPSWSETLTIDDLVERNNIYYKKFNNVPFTGKVSGIENGSFQKGKKNGEWLRYHENGQLHIKSNYKDGKENGQLRYSLNFKDDKLNGLSKSFGKNGQLLTEEIYKDGKLNGLSKSYYENGQLHIKFNYKDGKLDGLVESFSEDGSLINTQNWKDGVIQK